MLINCEAARELQWFPLCNIDVQFNCRPQKSMCASLFPRISLLKFPGWAGIASSWLIWISKETTRGASLGCMSSLSLECRRCPYCQPRVLITDQVTLWGNICPESLCVDCVVDRQLVVVELALKIILETFEYQISKLSTKESNDPYSQRY